MMMMIMKLLDNLAGENPANGAPSLDVEDRALDLPGACEGMIIVDLSLQPVALDRGGESILNELNRGRSNGNSIVDLPLELLERLSAGDASDLTTAPMRVSVADDDYSCRAFVMKPPNGDIGKTLIAIHLKRERSVNEAIRRVGAAYHLTPREQEAVVGVSMGLTSKQVADRMNISPNTVNAFLRLIMGKMSVTTRAGIVGKLLNGKGPQPSVSSKISHPFGAREERSVVWTRTAKATDYVRHSQD
jgi:DNA-binding CsgD family transcriptional regulator